MNKKGLNFFLNVIILVAAASAISLFIASEFSDTFNFSLNWAGFVIAVSIGLVFIAKGIFVKNIATKVVGRRFMVYFGAIFLIVGVLCLVWEFALTSGQALGIIALVAVVALLLATVFINSRFRYDAGDNRQGNYKNYHQRKADREAQAQENSNQNPNQAENQSNCKKYNFFGLNVEVDENENGENVSVKLGGLNINVVDGKNKESVNINLNGKDIVDISEDKKE